MAKFARPSDDTLTEAIGIVMKMDDGSKQGKFGGYELKYHEKYPQNQNPDDLIRFFIPDSSSFNRIKKPSSSDWLSNQTESGQSFLDFTLTSHNTPTKDRNIIYLQPFTIQEENVPQNVLNAVQTYSHIFFGMEIRTLNPISLKGSVPERINQNSQTLQVNARSVLDKLRPTLPKDAFCLAGLTLCDLYPKDEWNFVFGLASYTARCGVHSLARYLDNFGKQQNSVFDVTSESTFLHRTCKTLCHEIGHMFGLFHCVYFDCLMNGSNHLEELDSRPIFLCPVCLRKLHFSCRFDIQHRYRQMLDFWTTCGLETEVLWLRNRLSFLQNGDS